MKHFVPWTILDWSTTIECWIRTYLVARLSAADLWPWTFWNNYLPWRHYANNDTNCTERSVHYGEPNTCSNIIHVRVSLQNNAFDAVLLWIRTLEPKKNRQKWNIPLFSVFRFSCCSVEQNTDFVTCWSIQCWLEVYF